MRDSNKFGPFDCGRIKAVLRFFAEKTRVTLLRNNWLAKLRKTQ